MPESDVETWKNASAGKVWVWVHDRTGKRTDRHLTSGSKIQITPLDRQLNQEMAANAELDPFRNGILVPVRLVETAEDFADIEGNPNHITEDEVVELFNAPWKTFDKRVGEISNLSTINRMVALAQGDETNAAGEPLVEATMRQVKVLQARLDALASPAEAQFAGPKAGAPESTDGPGVGAVTP